MAILERRKPNKLFTSVATLLCTPTGNSIIAQKNMLSFEISVKVTMSLSLKDSSLKQCSQDGLSDDG